MPKDELVLFSPLTPEECAEWLQDNLATGYFGAPRNHKKLFYGKVTSKAFKLGRFKYPYQFPILISGEIHDSPDVSLGRGTILIRIESNLPSRVSYIASYSIFGFILAADLFLLPHMTPSSIKAGIALAGMCLFTIRWIFLSDTFGPKNEARERHKLLEVIQSELQASAQPASTR